MSWLLDSFINVERRDCSFVFLSMEIWFHKYNLFRKLLSNSWFFAIYWKKKKNQDVRSYCHILLLIFVSAVPNLLPRFSISTVASACVSFIVPISIFRSWKILFIFFICSTTFSCIFKCLLISSLRNSTSLYISVFFQGFIHFLFKGLHHL